MYTEDDVKKQKEQLLARGKILREAREAAHMVFSDVQKLVKVPTSTLSGMELGNTAGVKWVKPLCEIYGLDPSKLPHVNTLDKTGMKKRKRKRNSPSLRGPKNGDRVEMFVEMVATALRAREYELAVTIIAKMEDES